ncbi:MAG: aspartate aminotransferase family protein [Gaiellaceae bacterium]|nr:MAG: aspartate aminotransferase family protein [Gaiellaceae bacterium]
MTEREHGVETKLWHGQAHMPEVKRAERLIVRGEGAYVWDAAGHRVFDFPASLWYCNVGHGRTEIATAVATQMNRIAAYSNFQEYATPPAVELAERLAAVAPMAGARVFFTNGGSDAVELAAKLVRAYWRILGRPEKTVLVSREHCYHGLHGFGTSIAGMQQNREGYGALLPDVVRVPHDDLTTLERLLVGPEGARVAAVFCEPIIGTGGLINPAPGYLESLKGLCRTHDVLLVVDEVVTGFGRTGRMFASERFHIEPDILLFAKGVTSGYMPLGGALISGRVAEPFWADGSPHIFRHGLTYQGHAAACAAAHANLDILEREGLVARAVELESVLADALAPLRADPWVVEVRMGKGLLAGVVLPSPELAADVVDRCWQRGVLTRRIGAGDTLHLSPPLVADEHELRWACGVIGLALESARRASRRARQQQARRR